MTTDRRGFGLIEVIAAISLMAIAILSVGAISIRMARTESVVRSRAAQVATMRRTTAYWSTVPYGSLPAAGTQVCDTVAGTTRVRTCAAASNLVVAGVTARRLLLTAVAIDGAVAKADTSTVDRSVASSAPPL